MTTIEEYNLKLAELDDLIRETTAERTRLTEERNKLHIPEWIRSILSDDNHNVVKRIETYEGSYQLNCVATFGTHGVYIRQSSLCRTVDDYNHFIRMIKEVNHALRS